MQTLQAPEIEHLALFQSEFGEHRRIAERGFEDGRIRVVFEMSTRDIFVVTCMWVVLDN